MTITLERPDLAALTDSQLSEVAGITGDPDAEAAAAELAKRRHARAAKIRAGQRARREGWGTAARANFAAAEEFCRGDDNMLSPRGKATALSAWDLWHGSEERARLYASDDLIRFWDYHQPRPPGPNEYRDAEREAAAEQHARQDMPSPGMLAAIAAARGEAGESPAPVAARTEPGSLVRVTALLRAMRNETDALSRSLERVNEGVTR